MEKLNKKILILVVEDEKILCKTLEEILSTEGFDVLAAHDGEEGLELAIKEKPDLILLDLLMPKLDGMSLLKKLRQDSWGKDVKVIILSNLGDPRNIQGGEDLGAYGVSEYMVKTSSSLDGVILKIKKELGISN